MCVIKLWSWSFKERKIPYATEKSIEVRYKGESVGFYKPDFIISDKVILELKVASVVTRNMQDQAYHYVKGTKYKLGLLVNFGSKKLTVKRFISSAR